MSRIRFRTLLFDVDGTLIDSNGAHAEAWTTALREYGVDVNVDQIRRMIGMGGDKILPAIAHVSEDSDQGKSITQRKKRIFNSLLPSLQPTPGARSLIPERTSKDDAQASKPDPDIVHAALVRSNARPKYTALIGDTPYDIEAADRAGIDAIALRCGGYWPDASLRGAVKILDDPQALLAHWRSD